MKFFSRKSAKKDTSKVPQFPETTFQNAKKPKGDILFHVESDYLVIPNHSTCWLVAYDRSTDTYCQAERVPIEGSKITKKDLILMMQTLEPISDISRIRLCLYFPDKNTSRYIKSVLNEDHEYTRVFLLDPRPLEHVATHRYVYTSDGGLLSVGLAAKLFRPKEVLFIPPSDIVQPDQIMIRRSLDLQDSDIVYYGIYNKQERTMFPVLLTGDAIRLSEIIEKCTFLRSGLTDTLLLCLICIGKEVTCRYIAVANPPSSPDMDTYEPVPLDNKYNALITEPALVPNQGYVALARTTTGRIVIQAIEEKHLDKYHNSLLSEDLPALVDPDLFKPFDPEERDIDPILFFQFIEASINALSNAGILMSQNYQLQKRIVYNLSEMLAAISDTKSKYDTSEISYNNEWQSLTRLMQMIDDDIVMQTLAARYIKLFLLNAKYDRPCDQEEHISNILLKYNDTDIFSIGSTFLRIDIVEIKDNTFNIEGYLRIPEKSIIDDSLELITYVNDVAYLNTPVPRYSDRYVLDRTLSKDSGFKLSIPLEEDYYTIAFGIKTHGFVSMCAKIEFTGISPIGNKLKNAYYVCDDYVIRSSRNRLMCRKYYDEETLLEYEESLRTEIIKGCEDHADEVISLRQYYFDFLRNNSPVEKWLLIDRADRADDNAEVLFRHLVKAQYPNIEPIFILSKDSPQFEELSELGTVYDFHSEEHLKAFLTCKYVFSSQMAPSTTNPFNEDFAYFRDIIRQKRFVFLQHGVTHNDNGNAFSRYARNFYGIVVNANDEYNYMLTPEFNNPTDSIWLTGMPRFDMLHDDNRRMITIMPTWRKSLTSRVFDEEKGTNIWAVSDAFAESEYFNFYNSLINDPRVVQAAKAHNYTIFFMPHPQFMSKADLFDNTCPECISICTDDIRYRDVFAMSSLILTDYSSVVFDFAYLHKPVLYAQFDKEAFFKAHTVKPGYYNFEDHGFGEVTYNYEDTVTNLVSYIENDCQMKEKYRQRVDSFFRYTDHNCCERICRKVFELEGKK